ncbi:hypothetical protein V3391_09955 [Luteimonas sp. SMYT11W]|uniref:Uncharacterized protein n=1 Tax=Luteimonas flava TaxID=3115822 RepID=A0ABU7WG81_9GAMM
MKLAVFVAFVFFLIANLALLLSKNTSVYVEMRSTGTAQGQLFYAVDGGGYSAEQETSLEVVPDGEWRRYHLEIPVAKRLSGIRIDPGGASGELELRSISLHRGWRTTALTDQALARAVNASNNLEQLDQGRAVSFRVVGGDPYIGFNVEPPGGRTLATQIVSSFAPSFAAGFVALLGALMLQRLAASVAWQERFGPRIRHVLTRLARQMTDRNVLEVSPAMVLVMICTFAAAGCYVALNLNQSSVGVWDGMFGRPAPTSQIYGEPKSIRSDEWNVQTPWILSQKAAGFSVSNENVGGERAPLVAGVPVDESLISLNPKFLGLFVFESPDRGISWLWAFKSFSLFAGFVWLFLILTRGDLRIALIGGVWVYGSSFVQWWFSSGLPDILSGFAFSCVGALYFLFGCRIRSVLAGALVGLLGVVMLISNIYPPFIVPLAYLGAAIVIGFGFSLPSVREALIAFPKAKVFTGVVCALAVGAGLYGFAEMVKPTLDVMTATVYPGQRVSVPGEIDYRLGAVGLFEYLRADQGRFPGITPNASEAGNFLILAPFALLLLPITGLLKRRSAVVLALVGYIALVSAWVFVDLPANVASVMQTGGWKYVPSFRALFGIGLASIILCLLITSGISAKALPRYHPLVRLVLVTVFTGLALAVGLYFRGADPVFFTPITVLLGACAVALITTGMAFGRVSLLAIGVTLVVAPSLTVNPISVGTDSLTAKPSLLRVAELNRASDRWMTIDDFIFSQGMKAHGLNVFNGARMLPDHEEMALLDPDAAYAEAWNRYANVVVASVPGTSKTEFGLPGADLYVIKLDVCGAAPRSVGITKLVYTQAVPSEDLACLNELQTGEPGVRVFEYRDPP